MCDPRNFDANIEAWAWELGKIYQLSVLGNQLVVVSDDKAVQEVLKARPNLYTRGLKVASVFHEMDTEGLFSDEGDRWKRARQLVTPAFSTSRVQEMTSAFIEHSISLKQKLIRISEQQQEIEKNWFAQGSENKFKFTQLIDVLSAVQESALKIIMQVAFSWGQANITEQISLYNLQIFFQTIGDRLISPIQWHKLFISDNDRVAAASSAQIKMLIQKIIQKYSQLEQSEFLHRTFLESILRTRNENSKAKLPDDVIIGNIQQVMIAGFETTSSSVHWIMYFLATYPHIQEKFHQEVDSVIADSESLVGLEAKDFPYTQAIIKESMRLRPVAPIVFASPKEDVTILGHKVQKDSLVLLATRVTSMKEWPEEDPFVFRPERWIHDDEELHKKQMNLFYPFGGGTRICPGRHMALAEMTFLLAIGIAPFQIEFFPVPPHVHPPIGVSKFTTVPDSLYLKLTGRNK